MAVENPNQPDYDTNLLVRCMVSRPTISAAVASLGAQGCRVELNTNFCKKWNIDPDDVGAKLRMRIVDNSTGLHTQLVYKANAEETTIVTVDGESDRFWGTSLTLSSTVEAGSYQLDLVVDIFGNIEDEDGNKIIDDEDVSSVSCPFFLVAS